MTTWQLVWQYCGTAVLLFITATWLKDQIDKSTTEITRRLDHMAAVQIEQEDLDEVASKLEDLTTAVGEIDTSKLDPADQTRLQSALTGLTGAVNEKLPVEVDPGDGAV